MLPPPGHWPPLLPPWTWILKTGHREPPPPEPPPDRESPTQEAPSARDPPARYLPATMASAPTTPKATPVMIGGPWCPENKDN
jgi:hypothetical protein